MANGLEIASLCLDHDEINRGIKNGIFVICPENLDSRRRVLVLSSLEIWFNTAVQTPFSNDSNKALALEIVRSWR